MPGLNNCKIQFEMPHFFLAAIINSFTILKKIFPCLQRNRLLKNNNTERTMFLDSMFTYFKHGPLAREVIGDQQVQGIDYAYTLQGWLKGVNSTAPWNYDMGNDGLATSSSVARDAFGFALNYFGDSDYLAIQFSKTPFATGKASSFRALFNGNIAAMSMYMPKFGNPVLYNYRYDQLNRIVRMQTSTGLDTVGNLWQQPVAVNDYKENISYDANGNILSYRRYANSTGGNNNAAIMDSLKYFYKTNTNQLTRISDTVADNAFANDIDNELANNYTYDNTGNLTKDVKNGIDSIYWTVYGKVSQVNKHNGTIIKYTYDATGNRISETVGGVTTWYVRDATGNVMTVYTAGNSIVNGGDLTQSEIFIYGSSRIGTVKPAIDVQSPTGLSGTHLHWLDSGYIYNFIRGQKFYELSNHLGNVLVIISDKKIGAIPASCPTCKTTSVPYFMADVVNAQDYYPFGMLMPGRTYIATSAYRYGFNGKEQDSAINGNGVDYDYGFRVYDARIAKFLSTDPLGKKYPWYTPYQFAGNKPIWATDVDGLEENTTSTYVYHRPVIPDIANKPTFAGIISITDATTQVVHKAFEGNFSQLRKADATGFSTSVVNQLTGLNSGTSDSRLAITMAGTRSQISKTWQGTDIKYFTQYSYSFTSNNITEIGTFEINIGSIKASARIWDPLTFLIVNKVVSTIIGAEIFTGSSKAVGGELSSKFIYRFDTRSIEEIKAVGGFEALGKDLNLLQHVTGNGTESGYISTSTEEGVLEKLFGSQKGYIYKIKWQDAGKNVNEILGSKSPHPEELEVAVPGKIASSDIISVKPVNQ